jgi:hypothetical protein
MKNREDDADSLHSIPQIDKKLRAELRVSASPRQIRLGRFRYPQNL